MEVYLLSPLSRQPAHFHNSHQSYHNQLLNPPAHLKSLELAKYSANSYIVPPFLKHQNNFHLYAI